MNINKNNLLSMKKNLPEEFDWECYLRNNKDLTNKGIDTKESAEKHFLTFGYKENRFYKNDYVDLLEKLKVQIDKFKNLNFVKPIYIFYHIYCDNDWKNIVEEQVEIIKISGLYENTEKLFFVVFGDLNSFEFIKKKYKSNKINFIKTEKKYEFPTLDVIKKISKENDFKGLYIHTKGTSKPKENKKIIYWRKIMGYYNIVLWKINYSVLDSYDVAGCNVKNGNMSIKDYWDFNEERNYPQKTASKHTKHYSGNFWWFNSIYVNKLRDLTVKEKTNRYNAEWYIFMEDPKNFNWETPPNLTYKLTDFEFNNFNKTIVNNINPNIIL